MAQSRLEVWAQTDGEATTVHTPFTTRAKELMDLYNGLRLPLLSIDERLDVLLHVKWTVKEFDCNLTREAPREQRGSHPRDQVFSFKRSEARCAGK